jgi:phenylacetate-CoA ligase
LLKAETWSKPINAIYPTGPLFALNVVATLEQQLEWLDRIKLDYLTSYASNLIALTHYAKSIKRALPKILELRTSGETLTADDAKFLSEAWDTKVVDMYSCEEVGYLALQCPDQPCYHIQSEHVILEVVDEQGRACGPGEVGRVVITDLHNFATPFIRYDIGDHAEVGGPCACGRGLPTLKRILGRTRNRLTLPDGRKVFPRLGERSLSSIPDVSVLRFRVIQRSLTTIELQLVCSRPLNEQEKSEVAAKLQKSLGHPFEIIFSFLKV